MMRSTPFRVLTSSWTAISSAVPFLKNPPTPAYSPSVFSRITIKRMSRSVRSRSGVKRASSSSVGRALTNRSSLKRRPRRMSAACRFQGTRGSPSAPSRIASNSLRNISTAPAGSVTPSFKYFSAPQSSSMSSIFLLPAWAATRKTLQASGITSRPMPSPGITAMRKAEPPRLAGRFLLGSEPGELIDRGAPCLFLSSKLSRGHASTRTGAWSTRAETLADTRRSSARSLGARLEVAARLDPIDAPKHQCSADQLIPGAFFAEPPDAEDRGGHGQQVAERAQLRWRHVAQQPEVQQVSAGGAEDGHVGCGRPALPADGAPVGSRANAQSFDDSHRQGDDSAEDLVEGRHGQGVVAGGHALAEHGVEREAQRTGHGDGVAEQRRRTRAEALLRGENDDSDERHSHAHDFAHREPLQAHRRRQGQNVDRSHANNHRRMADRGVAQPGGKANLVHANTEESEVREDPEIAKRKTGRRPGYVGREDAGPPANQVGRDHDNAGKHDAK